MSHGKLKDATAITIYGGSPGTKLITAYRENSIHIACCLKKHGQLSPRRLENSEQAKRPCLSKQKLLHLFEKVEKGIYKLSSCGEQALLEYPQLVSYYNELINKTENREE
jgi:hypothetical protein